MVSEETAMRNLPVAVLGAGPVGLAAAAHLAGRGVSFLVLESGPAVGHAIRQWGHVQLFSPWRYCIDRQARHLLATTGWQSPDEDSLPSGHNLVDLYLAPLAAHPAIAPHIRLNARVLTVARLGIDKLRTMGRDAHPFELRLEDGSILLARAVIDATGTWSGPNPAGSNGLPASGEQEACERLSYGIPDVRNGGRSRFAHKRVLVVGAGHSAINSVLNLLELKRSAPSTSITWALRRAQLDRVYGGGDTDALPARGALGTRARLALGAGSVQLLAPFSIDRLERSDTHIAVTGTLANQLHAISVDEIVVATGFRPDLDMLRELRLGLDSGLDSTLALGPLIDPNIHSCGTVPPHGFRELMHPEPDFFVIGSKSYGRAPTFLMATGFEQARSVVAHLAGDDIAAAQVELVLPETGVCGGSSLAESACCTSESSSDALPLLTTSGCCGGPALDNASACCALDADAKAAGLDGCGCSSESQPTSSPSALLRWIRCLRSQPKA